MKTFIKLFVFSFLSQFINAQVTVGNTEPATGTILHVDDNSGTKGVKLPDTNIVDLNTVDPLPIGTEEGTIVYNTKAFTGQGYFYWNGFLWAPIQLFRNISAKFNHDGPIGTTTDLNLNQVGAGVDVEIMDNTVFNEATTLFTPVVDANGRTNSIQVSDDGRYRITVFIGLEQDDSVASSGSTSIQGRLKITNISNVVRFDGSYHRSSEMEKNGSGDDDGTLYFTEVVELNSGEKVSVNCTNAEGTSAVYQRDPYLSAIIIEKLR